MITELAESECNFLGFEISGKVTLEEEKEWVQKFEDCLEHHQKLNVLIVLDEGATWGVDAGIEGIKWVMKHMKSIDKTAFVSSRNVWKWLVSIDSFFAAMVGIQEKHFDHSGLAAAWKWIKH
jgi:hypothetical protein